MTPDQIKKLFAKAMTAREAGHTDEAARLFGRLLKARPNTPEALYHLARLRGEKGDRAEASKLFEAALKLKPGQSAIWLAYLQMASTHPDSAPLKRLLGRLGGALDDQPVVSLFRAMVLKATDPDQAEELVRDAIENDLTDPRAPLLLAELLAQRDAEAAATVLETASLSYSGNPEILARRAELLRDLGRFDDAREAARDAIRAAPARGALYYTYASISKTALDDPIVQEIAEKSRRARGPDLVFLAHAEAKAREDQGDLPGAFASLKRASRELGRLFPYDIARDREEFARLRSRYLDLAPHLPADVATDAAPIFVTGLPRSGTTLVEQIIASHSAITGAGELALLGPMLTKPSLSKSAPQELVQSLGAAGEAYMAEVLRRFGGAQRITDKSISTVLLQGFVLAALPKARIIVVTRDPRDNAISLYKSLFALGTHRYTQNLQDIARYMRLVEDQRNFWADQLDQRIFEISYEKLVADPEQPSRDLIAFCGLDWEQACRDFHLTERHIGTLSSAQVRRPLYSSSIGKWRQIEDDLAPFTQTYLDLGGQLPTG